MTTVDPLYESRDFSSFSNFAELEVKNIKLEWDLNFETKVISGLVEHELMVKKSGVATAIFDSSNITINGAIYVNGQKTSHSFGEKNDSLGTPLTVEIPESFRQEGTVLKILIFYSASPTASAVQWLEPGATKGKTYPYVFTQSQAIHARSLLPCMDSPGVKASYSAIVTAPAWCTVLMSAVQGTAADIAPVESPVAKPAASEVNTGVFYWNQPVATSAYLIALVGGHLSSRDVSDRVRIWSEPDVVQAAHYEFSETEEFLKAAEDITGCPYQWGRYDVVCLPPSFPYGGMENPCLTFATPTLLAGDRSLADVIAHEIAHSWTGNLVTNSVWNHFWLNEGWTVWLERKITSKVKNNTEVGRLSAQIGFQHLKESVQGFAGGDERFTQMVWPLNGEDPDHAFSSVPYEKGFNLLNYLETIIGTENFEKFAKAYIDNFKFGVVSTGEFRDFFVQFVQDLVNTLNNPSAEEKEEATGGAASGNNKRNKRNKKKGGNGAANGDAAKALTPSKSFISSNLSMLKKVEDLDWNALFLTPGMPTYPIDFTNSLATMAHDLANKWISSRHSHSLSEEVHFHGPRPDMDGWSSQQKCLFLEDLLEASTVEPFSVNYLANLDRAFGFGSSQNSEIMLRWQQLCIRANCPWIYEPAVDFLTSQGRMKFVRPILRDLRRSQIGGSKIAQVFDANKDAYHPIARKMLGEDLVRIQKEEDENAAVAAQKAAQSTSSSTKSASVASSSPMSPSSTKVVVAPEDLEQDEVDGELTPAAVSSVAPTNETTTEVTEIPVEVSLAGEVDEPVEVNPAVLEVAQEVVEQVERITTPHVTPVKKQTAESETPVAKVQDEEEVKEKPVAVSSSPKVTFAPAVSSSSNPPPSLKATSTAAPAAPATAPVVSEPVKNSLSSSSSTNNNNNNQQQPVTKKDTQDGNNGLWNAAFVVGAVALCGIVLLRALKKI